MQGTVLISKPLVREEPRTIFAFKIYLPLRKPLLFTLLVVYFVSVLCIGITCGIEQGQINQKCDSLAQQPVFHTCSVG